MVFTEYGIRNDPRTKNSDFLQTNIPNTDETKLF